MVDDHLILFFDFFPHGAEQQPTQLYGEDNSLLCNLPIGQDPPLGHLELTKEEEELLHQINCKREDIPGLQELARKHGDTYAGYLKWAAEFTQELVASGAMVFLPDEDS